MFFYIIENCCLGLDPDYVEYLKSKRYKEMEAERRMTAEQRQSNVQTVSIMSNEILWFSE